MSMLDKNKGNWVNRILVGTPTTGNVRMEWVNARYSQTIPTNWSHVDVQQWMSPYIPLGYQVADAENLIAKACVEGDFEWLLFLEHDNVLPPGAMVKINEYMIKGDEPVVAGLYFTKSVPPEPLVYREKGKGYFADWKLGEKVRVRGLPFGFTLISGKLIKELWKDAPEYNVNGTITRRVFNAPNSVTYDDQEIGWFTNAGTSDLDFCNKIIVEGYLERAGFPKHQKMENPFIVDTTIFVKHIDNQGVMYPIQLPKEFLEGKITYREALAMLT